MFSTLEFPLSKLSSTQEVRWIHGSGHTETPTESLDPPRFVSISGSNTGRKKDWRDNLIDIRDIDLAVQATRNMPDVYFSQASFRSKQDRKTSSFSQVRVCWVDIDMYDPTYDPDAWNEIKLKKILDFSRVVGIPEPSLIINSGRGAYVKWVFKSATNSLPIWNSLQESLTALYMDLHVDFKARDVSRVFRIIDTFNSKNFSRVNVLHQSHVEYDFMSFAKQIQSIRIDELDGAYVKGSTKSRKTTNVMRRGAAILEGAAAMGNLDALNLYTNLRAPIMLDELSEHSLHWSRFTDLRDLVQMRGGFRKGERDQMLLWMCNSLAQAKVITTENWDSEISSLIEGFPVGADFDPVGSGYLSSVKSRLDGQTNAAGQKTFLYRPRNQYLIDVLEITPDEQKSLKTIISKEEKYRRRKIKRDSLNFGRDVRRETRNDWKAAVNQKIATLLADFLKKNPNMLSDARGISSSRIGFNVSEFARDHEIDRTVVSKYCSGFIKINIDKKIDEKEDVKTSTITTSDENISPKLKIYTKEQADEVYGVELSRIKNMHHQQAEREIISAHKVGDAAREKLVILRNKMWANEKINAMIGGHVAEELSESLHKETTEKNTENKTEGNMPTVTNSIDRLRARISQKSSSRMPVQASQSMGVNEKQPQPQPREPLHSEPGGSSKLTKKITELSQRHTDPGRSAECVGVEGVPASPLPAEGVESVEKTFLFRAPAGKRPYQYPAAPLWGSMVLPCGSLFSESEWTFSKRDGRHFVVEIHDGTYSLERYINPEHPENAHVLENQQDAYGVIHVIKDTNQLKFIQSLNGCCLVRDKHSYRMPEALEEQNCIMAGKSYWVARPRSHYGSDSGYSNYRSKPPASRDYVRKAPARASLVESAAAYIERKTAPVMVSIPQFISRTDGVEKNDLSSISDAVSDVDIVELSPTP